jgi:hypothetical protein
MQPSSSGFIIMPLGTAAVSGFIILPLGTAAVRWIVNEQ